MKLTPTTTYEDRLIELEKKIDLIIRHFNINEVPPVSDKFIDKQAKDDVISFLKKREGKNGSS